MDKYDKFLQEHIKKVRFVEDISAMIPAIILEEEQQIIIAKDMAAIQEVLQQYFSDEETLRTLYKRVEDSLNATITSAALSIITSYDELNQMVSAANNLAFEEIKPLLKEALTDEVLFKNGFSLIGLFRS